MKRPFVIALAAMTADGKISSRAANPLLSGLSASKPRIQEAMGGADAVVSGCATVAGDMSLWHEANGLREARMARGLPPAPLRVIVSNDGRLGPAWKASCCTAPPPVIFSTARMPERLRSDAASCAELFLFQGKKVDLARALLILRADFGVRRLVCEGGGALLRALAEEDLVDEIRLAIAPVIVGGRLAPSLTGLPGGFLQPQREFRIARHSVVGGECCLELRRTKSCAI